MCSQVTFISFGELVLVRFLFLPCALSRTEREKNEEGPCWLRDLLLFSHPRAVFHRAWLEAYCVCVAHRDTRAVVLEFDLPRTSERYFPSSTEKTAQVILASWGCATHTWLLFSSFFGRVMMMMISLSTPPKSNKQHLLPLFCHFPPSSFYFSTPFYPISPLLPLTISPFQGPCRLSLLFTKYSLTKKWDFLLIEDQSGKVPSSKPAPSISRP